MANGTTHLLAGAAASMAACAFDNPNQKTAVSNPLLVLGLGSFFGKLPDIIEPATNPHHRQIFHSVLILFGVAVGIHRLYQWEPEEDFEKALRSILLAGGAAYLSHLALDALTSRTLPWVGKI